MDDINVLEFAEMLSYLEPHPPLTEKFYQVTKPYPSEKAHMYFWFEGQTTTGSGSYARGEPNNSAKTTYNRLLCPGAMLWIAEALGETPEKLNEAYQATETEKGHLRSQCKGFRNVIPWERICELYQHPEGWLYDKKILQFLRRSEDGYPVPVSNRIGDVIAEELLKRERASRPRRQRTKEDCD